MSENCNYAPVEKVILIDDRRIEIYWGEQMRRADNENDYLVKYKGEVHPHFSSQLPTYEKLSNDHNFQVFVIPKNIYSTLDGKSLLDFVLENYKETDHHE